MSCEDAVGSSDIIDPRTPPELAQHRVKAEACEATRPCNGVSADGPGAIVCRSHADCSDGTNGRCQPYGHACTYDACFTDSDCKSDELCDCAGGADGAHRCVAADCRTDADCKDGLGCSPSQPIMCFNLARVDAYHCHTSDDECTTGSDCADGSGCVFDAALAHWRCSDAACTVP